jgi:molecular chaperone DnaK (HSP70)
MKTFRKPIFSGIEIIYPIKFKKKIYKKSMTTAIIGIDFGTSYVRIGCVENEEITIIKNTLNETKIPNYITFTENEVVFGTKSKEIMLNYPKSTIFEAKRILGTEFQGESIKEKASLEFYRKLWPFELKQIKGLHSYSINKDGKNQMSPTEISTFILKELKTVILLLIKRLLKITWVNL